LQTVERQENRLFRSPKRTGKEQFFHRSADSDIEYAMFDWFTACIVAIKLMSTFAVFANIFI